MTTAPPSPNRSLVAALVLCTVGVTMFMIVPVFLGALVQHRSFSNSQVGILASIELAGASFAAVGAALWLPRVSWRWVSAAALLVAAVGAWLSAVITDFTGLVLLRFLTAFFGLGVVYALGMALVSRTDKPERNFGLVTVSQVLYSALALFTIPKWLEQWGMIGIAAPMTALALAGLLVVRWLPEGGGQGEPTPSRNGTGDAGPKASRSWPAMAGLGILALWYVGVGALWAFVELIGTSAGLEARAVGDALAIATLASLAGALLATWLGDRLGRKWPFAIAVALQVAMMPLFIQPSGWGIYLTAAIAFSATWNFAGPYLLGFIATSDETGRMSAIIPAAQGLGVGLGPIIGGVLADSRGLPAVVYLAAAVCLVAVGIFIPLVTRARAVVRPDPDLVAGPTR